ncbi:MAG TPA: hypothetical protein VN843_12610 [Anaerolineales bacterium]|nr:hypothetical protein [Anaerolineales bacterium]
MRRIIERVVTVVTTTTWTISWQDDSPHTSRDSQPAPVANEVPKLDVSHERAKHIQRFSPVITTKEADPVETKKETDSKAENLPLTLKSNQKLKGN